MTISEVEAEIIDALRSGASPVEAIAECARCECEEVLDVLLDLERQAIVRRRTSGSAPVPATRTWWELTPAGYGDVATG